MIQMAEQVLVQFRVDKELKQDVAEICDALGTDMPTVFRMCMKQIKITRGIPFATKLPENVVTRVEAVRKPVEMGSLTKEELDAEINKGIKSIEEGRVYSAEVVEAEMMRDFGV
jgi:addiction module RelB/DinJ family antitoxin